MYNFFSPRKEEGEIYPSSEEVQESIYPFHHELNITEGSEFLDDALRMKDQPIEETNLKKEG